MEWGLLELLFQGSCCFLEILAASADAGAGWAAVRARRNFKSKRAAEERGEPVNPHVKGVMLFLGLLFLGAILTIVVIVKWVR